MQCKQVKGTTHRILFSPTVSSSITSQSKNTNQPNSPRNPHSHHPRRQAGPTTTRRATPRPPGRRRTTPTPTTRPRRLRRRTRQRRQAARLRRPRHRRIPIPTRISRIRWSRRHNTARSIGVARDGDEVRLDIGGQRREPGGGLAGGELGCDLAGDGGGVGEGFLEEGGGEGGFED